MLGFKYEIPHPLLLPKGSVEYLTTLDLPSRALDHKMYTEFRVMAPAACSLELKTLAFRVKELHCANSPRDYLSNVGLNFEVSIDEEIYVTIDPRILQMEWSIQRCGTLLSCVQIICSDTQVEACRFNVCDAGDPTSLSFALPQEWTHRLIPDVDYITTYGYREFKQRVASRAVSFHERQDQAFWRGSLIFNVQKEPANLSLEEMIEASQRLRLCAIASSNKLIDAKCTAIWAPKKELLPSGLIIGFMGHTIDSLDFSNYKYLLDIDGFSCSWSGLFQKLITGSVVLKVSSPHHFRQWYYDKLKPWKNYVPLGSRLSDLPDVLKCLMASPNMSADLASSGKDMAESLDFESQMLYLRSKIIEF